MYLSFFFYYNLLFTRLLFILYSQKDNRRLAESYFNLKTKFWLQHDFQDIKYDYDQSKSVFSSNNNNNKEPIYM